MPEPPDEDGPVLVQTQAIGICTTDLEIINGEYGSAPPGQDRLIIGHESLGQVTEAAPGTGFSTGDLVVGIGSTPSTWSWWIPRSGSSACCSSPRPC